MLVAGREEADFAAAIADALVGIVDATELTRGNALDGVVGMDVVAFVVKRDGARHEVVDMANFE